MEEVPLDVSICPFWYLLHVVGSHLNWQWQYCWNMTEIFVSSLWHTRSTSLKCAGQLITSQRRICDL